jgi:hypothetical protein
MHIVSVLLALFPLSEVVALLSLSLICALLVALLA